MNDWDWFPEFESAARRRDDRERVRLAGLYHLAYACEQADPDRMLALCAEGRRLADRLGEPWWGLFYDHLRARALMTFKGDVAAGLEQAVRNTLELRKPLPPGLLLQSPVRDRLAGRRSRDLEGGGASRRGGGPSGGSATGGGGGPDLAGLPGPAGRRGGEGQAALAAGGVAGRSAGDAAGFRVLRRPVRLPRTGRGAARSPARPRPRPDSNRPGPRASPAQGKGIAAP